MEGLLSRRRLVTSFAAALASRLARGSTTACGAVSPIASLNHGTQFRQYRADAAVMLFTAPLIRIDGVGQGHVLVDAATGDGSNTVTLQFAAGSLPEKTRGLNRLGLEHEVVRRTDLGLELSYFGFMTSSSEKSLSEARNGLSSTGGNTVPYSAVQGSLSDGKICCHRCKVQLAAFYTWRECRQLADRIRESFLSEDGIVQSEVNEAGLGRTPNSFLNGVREAILDASSERESAILHDGRPYLLRTRKKQDRRAGLRFQEEKLVTSPERVVRLRGTIVPLGEGKQGGFDLWFEDGSAAVLPIRFEFQPRSFLRLSFEWEPAMDSRPPRIWSEKGKQMNSLHLHWKNPAAASHYRTGVSLHSHTALSRESLSFIPKMAHRAPFASAFLRNIEERYRNSKGRELDYGRAYWTPPLPPRDAYELEVRQVRDDLGINPIVSITDHDTLDACKQLRTLDIPTEVPYSFEWTVPFGPACFHLGVHNLPPENAVGIFRDLARYTAQPRRELLAELLSSLSALPDTLVVLNHPFSDEGRIGCRPHQAYLHQFIRDCRPWLHALELNALQSWTDNREVIALAEATNLPVISGGDRHACEANGNLNLTNAVTLSEFVAELRWERMSNVLFMPQCRESLRLRYVENIWQVMKDYPELPGRKRWSDRVFYITDEGPRPLSALLRNGGPAFVRRLMAVVGFCLSPHFRPALRLAFLEQSKVIL